MSGAIIIIITILFSAFFSGMEIAYLSANKMRIEADKQKGNVQQFNKSFLRSVRIFGRTYDLGMIAAYKIFTSSYMKDADKFPMMLRKGKIALLPSFKGEKKYIKRIFKKKDNQN